MRLFSKNKHIHRNSWYNIALNTLARKLTKNLVDGKQYYGIPFGHSFIDLRKESNKITVNRHTFLKNGDIVNSEETFHIDNFSSFMLPHTFDTVWENTSASFSITPEILKSISVNLSVYLSDVIEPHDEWIFPFYDSFIIVQASRIRKSLDKNIKRRHISGTIYLQKFNEEFGYGGSFSGDTISIFDTPKESHDIFFASLDYSIFRSLAISVDEYNEITGRRWSLITSERYVEIDTVL